MLYEGEKVQVSSIIPTVLLTLNMITLIVISFIKDKFELLNGIICIGFGLISFIFYIINYLIRINIIIIRIFLYLFIFY